jgi:hypothetical protein
MSQLSTISQPNQKFIFIYRNRDKWRSGKVKYNGNRVVTPSRVTPYGAAKDVDK